MTREELINKMALAIAEMEGYFVKAEKQTLAQRNANPGNIRRWKDADGRPYPTNKGYVDFVSWAVMRYPQETPQKIAELAVREGWRILRVLIGQYLDGKYTQGKSPSFQEMFRIYAPSSDSNDPENYARFVAGKLGAQPDQRLIDLLNT